MIDIVIAVEAKYVNPDPNDWYHQQVAEEDKLLIAAAEELNLKIKRVAWDDPNFDWASTRSVLIREIWDYFHRYDAFKHWLNKVRNQTKLINSAEIIEWNQDKHYLADVEKKGVAIVPTRFIEKGTATTLQTEIDHSPWEECILKPCVSGGARHTYKVNKANAKDYEKTLTKLLLDESMMLQPFVESIPVKGEISLVVINGQFTHAVLKKAKKGDFRVQDDWGGTLHDYLASELEQKFAEELVVKSCPTALYARVDLAWGDNDELLLVELELIEPELWFRRKPEAAERLIAAIAKTIS